jgi:hypothetical protein
VALKGSEFRWGGSQEFWLEGSQRFEDTLRIEANYTQEEQPLKLTLPTLCITYADMGFTNAIGGEQEDYPASIPYGPRFFSPPIELSGADVERYTWIRGADKAIIGPNKTEIIWHMWNTLVIPRLRIREAEAVPGVLVIPNMAIDVGRELTVDVMQLADGRAVGGIRVEKRHPQWQPRELPQQYDLWVRVADAETGEPLPEVRVNLLHWDAHITTPYGRGGFRLVEKRTTSSDGDIFSPKRPSGELDAVTLDLPGWRALARCYRPLRGQQVRFHMFAWRLKESSRPHNWDSKHSLAHISALTGFASGEILKRNGLASERDLKEGMPIHLPCYEASYRLEDGETIEWLAETFGYESPAQLAMANGLLDSSALEDLDLMKIPGWHYFYALSGDTLEQIDSLFGLPAGCSRVVDTVHHPDPRIPYESEPIAAPTKEFVEFAGRIP